MTLFDMAKYYYPKLWSKARIDSLVSAGKLTEIQAEIIYRSYEEKETGNSKGDN